MLLGYFIARQGQIFLRHGSVAVIGVAMGCALALPNVGGRRDVLVDSAPSTRSHTPMRILSGPTELASLSDEPMQAPLTESGSSAQTGWLGLATIIQAGMDPASRTTP